LTQAELAEQVTQLGLPMSRQTVAEIEGGGSATRSERVTLNEAVVLAAALSTPLSMMLLPMGVEPLDVGSVSVNRWNFQSWLRGDKPLGLVEFEDTVGDEIVRGRVALSLPAWRAAVQPLWAYETLVELQTKYDEARALWQRAEATGTRAEQRSARRSLWDAITAIDAQVERMGEDGVDVHDLQTEKQRAELRKIRRSLTKGT
jgi:hypothetical protein